MSKYLFVFDGQEEYLTPEVREKLRWTEKALQHEPIRYLVYAWRGEIKVRKGKVWGQFFPVDDTGKTNDRWLSKVPREYMKVNSYGKVLCRNEDEIPEAVEMVRKYHRDKRAAVIMRDAVTVSNIDSVIAQQKYRIITAEG